MSIKVMVNDLTGNMASKVAEHIGESSDFNLVPYTLAGPDVDENSLDPTKKRNRVYLIRHSERELVLEKTKHKDFISVDFTHPNAVNDNADFYCRHNLPFVMGTTGGDREALEQRVRDSNICAVIAPNMAKPIVAFQKLLYDFSHTYEGGLEGCNLMIRESHQGPNVKDFLPGKADTSGTAKAVVKYFNKLGIPFGDNEITKIRLREDQIKLGVPMEHLDGHGWHTYWIYDQRIYEIGHLKNPVIAELTNTLLKFLKDDPVFKKYGTLGEGGAYYSQARRLSTEEGVLFGGKSEDSYSSLTITHNVNGRDVYATGTLDAVGFLDRRMKEGNKGKVYSMVDVLEE